MDLQIDTYGHLLGPGFGVGVELGLGLIDRHLWAFTYRQTLMGMDLQIDSYMHGFIDKHLWAFTYRQTLKGMDLQMDTYGYGLIDSVAGDLV